MVSEDESRKKLIKSARNGTENLSYYDQTYYYNGKKATYNIIQTLNRMNLELN